MNLLDFLTFDAWAHTLDILTTPTPLLSDLEPVACKYGSAFDLIDNQSAAKHEKTFFTWQKGFLFLSEILLLDDH